MSADSGRNLLFGFLALRLDFVPREQLAQGLHIWQLDRSRTLGEVLQQQGSLSANRHQVLQALVEEHLAAHGGDPEQSLSTLGFSTAMASAIEGSGRRADVDVVAGLTSHVDTLATKEHSLPDGGSRGGRPPASARFRVVRPLAQGGLGEVFVAEDGELHREVALKTLQARFADDEARRARFLLEAEITGRLEHPGVVPVYGLTLGADGRPFYAMRFVKGETLLEALKRYHQGEAAGRAAGEHPLELRGLLTRFVVVCNTVAYAHSRGILHRDLKPANVLLGPYGETLVVDWGLAKTLGSTAEEKLSSETTLHPVRAGDSGPTELGEVMGTPAYVSPEQAAGLHDQLSPASDVYCLGATLYHLLTGRAPFGSGASKEVLTRVRAGALQPPRQLKRGLPRELEAICLKAMNLRPSDRYSSARHLAADLEHWLADEPVSALRQTAAARMGRWIRHHTTLAATLACVLLLAGITLLFGLSLVNKTLREQQARREQVRDRVDAFCNTSPQMVPAALKTIQLDQPEFVARLHEVWEGRDAGFVRPQRMRAGLALLAHEPEKVRDELLAWMLEAEDPAEVLLVRDVLRERQIELGSKAAEVLADPQADNSRRMRALAALAVFDSDNALWPEAWAGEAVKLLAVTDVAHQGVWMQGLRPVHDHLLNPLISRAATNQGADFSQAVHALQTDLARNNPKLFAILLAEATPSQFRALRPLLVGYPESKTLERLIHEGLESAAAAFDAPERERELLARRQLNLAAALLHLDKPQAVWPLLRSAADSAVDPLPRTYLIHWLAALNVDSKILLARLEKETDAGVRQALILSVGAFAPEALPSDLSTRWGPRLCDWYRNDPDPGVHSAIDWLLRHDYEGRLPRPVRWGMSAELARIDQERSGQAPQERRWLVDKHGHTLAIFPSPVQVVMGSPNNEPDRGPNHEARRQRRIPRSFAVATKMVTRRQYQAFLRANPEVQEDRLKMPTRGYQDYGPETPARGLTWYDAALYCRWLDDLDQRDEQQKCFPSIEEIEKCRLQNKEVPLPKNYLERTGYRLPTDAEYEFFCRAGAMTSRFYGSSEELLSSYVWYAANAQGRSWPVGQKKPNDFGMFDVLGNGWQWLLAFEGQRVDWKNQPLEDREYFPQDWPALQHLSRHILASGSYLSQPAYLRCASRIYQPVDFFDPQTGLRVVRTLK